MSSIFSAAIWTNCPGTDNKWRIEGSKRRLRQSNRESTYHRHTRDIMSTSIKQERTICVLLPNKDQLDVTVGVGVKHVSSCPLWLSERDLNGSVSHYNVLAAPHSLWILNTDFLCLFTCSSQSPQGRMFLTEWRSFLESKSCTSLVSQWWEVSSLLVDPSASEPERTVHTRIHSRSFVDQYMHIEVLYHISESTIS